MSSRTSIERGYGDARVLVLGASGFIGRWVARALTGRAGHLSLVVRDRAAAESVFRQLGAVGAVIELDLLDGPATRNLIQETNPSVVFNLVGYGVDPAEDDEVVAQLTNVDLVETIALALAALPNQGWSAQRLVHVGSALEYGTAGGDLNEETVPRPTTIYGVSKWKGTQCVTHTSSRTGLGAVTARLFTVYGPGEHENRLLPSLLACAAERRPCDLTVGAQKRDFTYVEDVAEALLRLGLSGAEPGAVINVATGKLTEVREMARVAAGVLGIPSHHLRFGRKRTRFEETAHRPVSIERLRATTGWSPRTSIWEGVHRTQAFISGGP